MVITIVDRKNTKKSCGAPFYILGVASALMAVVTSFAHAAEWKIQPTTEIRETYSDNIKLAAQGAEKNDFATEIIPGISIIGTGRDLQVSVNYAMQNLVYANSSSADTIRNQLSANAHAVLIDDLFFWDARGAITQQNISSLGPQTSDNINDTGNRANVKTYTLSPYLRHRFGEAAVTELHYTHDGVSTNTALLNSNIDTALFKLDSGPSFNTLGWGFLYNDQKTNYGGSSASVEMQSASTNLSYRLTPRFSWTETVGYEKNGYAWSGGNPAGRVLLCG
ncbi:MAG: TIGR03016 family PEP-CTERM system-associated outer membrane protein, partial [Burkholderiaceae bacterium]